MALTAAQQQAVNGLIAMGSQFGLPPLTQDQAAQQLGYTPGTAATGAQLDAACRAAWSALSAGNAALVSSSPTSQPNFAGAAKLAPLQSAYYAAAAASFTNNASNQIYDKQAQDLQCKTYSPDTLHTALQKIDQWAANLGVQNYRFPLGADAWLNQWNDAHQSIVGQFASSVGGLAGGIISGAGNVLGGQQNIIGQALNSAGAWVNDAVKLAGNNPVQAAADAAAAAPGAVLAYAFATPLALAAIGGAIVNLAGAATGNKDVANAGKDFLGGEAMGVNAALKDPLSSSELVGGIVLSAVGAAPVGAGLIGAGVGGLAKDIAQGAFGKTGPNGPPAGPGISAGGAGSTVATAGGPKKSKLPLFLGATAAAVALGVLTVVLL